MKKIIILFIVTLLVTVNTNAQLFDRLKDKAAKALEKKPAQKTTNSTDVESNQNKETEKKADEKTVKKTLPPGSECAVIFTLAENEKLLYDETEVKVVNNKISYAFVVANNKSEYFLIEDGKRSGPFKVAPIKSMKPSEESEDASSNNDDNISMGNDNKDPIAMQYSKTIAGKLNIVFNGKNFGPYDYVSKMIVSTDKKQFFALVTIGSESPMMAKMGMGNCYMVNEAGLKQKVGTGGMSMPMKFSVSKGFKHSMASVMDQKSQKLLCVTSTGKEEEGNMADMYTENSNTSFVNDYGDIVTIPSQSPTQILVNGKEAASFKVPIKSMDRLFLMPDVSKSVYYEKGKIYKADGTEQAVTGALFPKVISINNQTTLCYYRMYKNDSGAKDVYVCKTVL